jgi:hypothetical protein
MGKIAATYPYQSTVPGSLYAGIASTRHNMEISNFFSGPYYTTGAANRQQNANMNAIIASLKEMGR